MGLAMEMANPLLESFRESPKAYLTNSNHPWWTSMEKETQICHWFGQTIGLLTWHSLWFNHLVLSTFRQCRSAIPLVLVSPKESKLYGKVKILWDCHKIWKKNISLDLRFLQNFLAFSENLSFMVGPVFGAHLVHSPSLKELFWLTTFKLTD